MARVIKNANEKKTIYSIELQSISEALISSGYTSLDQQAKALGVGRSTAWTITKNKHKLGRLSAKTINRILYQSPNSSKRSPGDSTICSQKMRSYSRKTKAETNVFLIGENKRWPELV